MSSSSLASIAPSSTAELFDIAPPPALPWTPEPLHWLLPLAALALFLLFRRMHRRLHAPHPRPLSRKEVSAAIEKIIPTAQFDQPLSDQQLSELSALAQSLCCIYLNTNALGLTPQELLALAQERNDAKLCAAVTPLRDLTSHRFAPPAVRTLNVAQIRKALEELFQ